MKISFRSQFSKHIKYLGHLMKLAKRHLVLIGDRIIHKETELSTQRIDRRTRDSGEIIGVVSGDRITCGTRGFNRT